MDRQNDTGVEAIMEHLIEHGANDIATVFARAFELAMRIERERFLGVGHFERPATRQGYANGIKPPSTSRVTVAVSPSTSSSEAKVLYYSDLI